MSRKENMSIPSLDLSDYLAGDSSRKGKFIRSLGKAYEEVGFVAIKNHGFEDSLRDELYNQVQNFFELDNDEKYRYERPKLNGQRGYNSFGKEHAKGNDSPDLKEFWQFGQCIEDDHARKVKYPKNVSVTELPQFNPIGMKTYKKLEEIGTNILRAIAVYLELDENYFDGKVKNGNSILRAIHYPPITSEPKESVRAAEHEDINLITLLMGASAEGLEVLSRQGDWVAVTALPEHIVVNVGDMLQRLTNSKLRSTTHRVVNPPKEKWGSSRYSIPFFLHPVEEMDLTSLDGCVDKEHPKEFEDMTAGAYLDERLAEIGLKA
jgi:isopenicillin N synthase-like dioxygenase